MPPPARPCGCTTPKVYLGGSPTHFYNSRGVAYWSDGDDVRIFFGTNESYLLALDAATGQPVLDFGDGGRVDLMEGIPPRRARRDQLPWAQPDGRRLAADRRAQYRRHA